MPTGELLQFTAAGQLFERISPRRLKQAKPRHGTRAIRRHQRLRDEIHDTVSDVRGRGVAVRDDGTRGLQRKGGGGCGEAAQQNTLWFGEKLVTPIESRA